MEKSSGKKGSGNLGSGKQTLRLRSSGPATVEIVSTKSRQESALVTDESCCKLNDSVNLNSNQFNSSLMHSCSEYLLILSMVYWFYFSVLFEV